MTEHQRYAICVSNRGYSAALEVRKVYRLLPDPGMEDRGLVRVIDESGEDYAYPAEFFVAVRQGEGARASRSIAPAPQ